MMNLTWSAVSSVPCFLSSMISRMFMSLSLRPSCLKLMKACGHQLGHGELTHGSTGSLLAGHEHLHLRPELQQDLAASATRRCGLGTVSTDGDGSEIPFPISHGPEDCRSFSAIAQAKTGVLDIGPEVHFAALAQQGRPHLEIPSKVSSCWPAPRKPAVMRSRCCSSVSSCPAASLDR